jgi:GDPmannose 4,6-dehydratase
MKALICGVNGQDGAYLAQLLIGKGYEVWGTSRNSQTTSFGNLNRLGLREAVTMRSMIPTDFRSVISVMYDCVPDELYFLASQSSVGLSFEQPAETLESVAMGALNLMEAIRILRRPVRFYNAGSSECFGNVGSVAADEDTPFAPRSPYAVAKASAHWLVANYREAYGLYACSGILFNHESPLRAPQFVTAKIASAAARIGRGADERLKLGRLDVVRDWGWAPEYVEAMWRMLQRGEPRDYIISTGEAHSLEQFVAAAFAAAGLDWHDHVETDPGLLRPTDIAWSQGNPRRAAIELRWSAQFHMREVAGAMVEAQLSGLPSARARP